MLEAIKGAEMPQKNEAPSLRKPQKAALRDFAEMLRRDVQKPAEESKLPSELEGIKEGLKALEAEGADKETLAPLKEITALIQKTLEKSEGSELSPLLHDLLAQLVFFVKQATAELKDSGTLTDSTRYTGEKIAFSLEGMVQDILAETLSPAQKREIKEMTFQAKGAGSDSLVFLAPEKPAFMAMRKAEALLSLAEASPAETAKDSSKDSPKETLTVRDLRTPLKSMLQGQAVEAKLSDARQDKDPSAPPLFDIASLPKTTFIPKAEAVFVPAAKMEALLAEVSARSVFILRDGGSEFKMKLTPPELGQMKISFRIDDGLMQGKIVVSTPEAKALFEENMHLLKESLQKSGVNISHVDVSLGGQSDFEEAKDILERPSGLQAVRRSPVPNAVEMLSRGLSISEIDYTA